ncbi:MAG: hypothetical protein H6613_13835 [Ignavibacteriales bacterium]|nr:hypothetical protein [Ignavibacteriales bacterium]
MKIRKLIRKLHRDVGYIAFGLTIIYSISGIAVNHVSDWNPNYSIEKDSLIIPINIDSTFTSENLVSDLTKYFSISDSIKVSSAQAQLQLIYFFRIKHFLRI